jgi:hypothetical protein
MDLKKETVYEGMGWIELGQDGVKRWVFVNTVMNSYVP